MIKIMTAAEAVQTYVKDGATLAFTGFVGGMHPEQISVAIKESFLSGGHPGNLTIIYAAGQGDGKEKGLNNLGIEGLVTRIIGGHYGLTPKLQKLALDNKAAAYNFPQGVISHLFRDIAARKPGVITHVGLKTYVDPRLEGGKLQRYGSRSRRPCPAHRNKRGREASLQSASHRCGHHSRDLRRYPWQPQLPA